MIEIKVLPVLPKGTLNRLRFQVTISEYASLMTRMRQEESEAPHEKIGLEERGMKRGDKEGQRGEGSENCSIKWGPETQARDQRWETGHSGGHYQRRDRERWQHPDWARWQHPDQVRVRARSRVR